MLGPIFWKEVKDEPKRKRLFESLLAYAGALSAVAALCHLTGLEGNVARYDFGRVTFAFVCWSQLFIGCLLAPMMCAATICDEKEHNSLELLLLTLMSDREIVLSKFAARLLALELFLSTSLPVSGLVMSMGGVTLGEMLAGQALVASALCLAAAFGMVCGAWFAKAHVAGFVAYMLFAIATLGPACAANVAWQQRSPVAALFYLLHTQQPPEWTASVYYSLGLTLVLLMVCTRKLNPATISWAWAVGASASTAARAWTLQRLPERFRAARLRPIASGQPAVLWRELRGKSPRNSATLLVIYLLAGLGFVVTIASMHYFPLDAAYPFVALTIIGTALTVLVTTSGALAFSREKESGSVEVLMLTPLEPEQIVSGKITGIHHATMPLLVLATSTAVVYHMVWQWRNPLKEPVWLIADAAWFFGMYLQLKMYTVLAIDRSLRAKTSLQAILHSLLQLGVLVAGTTVLYCCTGAISPIALGLGGAMIVGRLGGMLGPSIVGVLFVGGIGWAFMHHVTTQYRARVLAFYDRDMTQDPEAAMWRDQALPRVEWRKQKLGR